MPESSMWPLRRRHNDTVGAIFFLEIVTSASGVIVTIYHCLDIPEQSSRLSWSRVIRWAVHSLSLTCCRSWPIKNTDDWEKQLTRLACLIHVWMLTSSFKWDLNRISFKVKHLRQWYAGNCWFLFYATLKNKRQVIVHWFFLFAVSNALLLLFTQWLITQ